MERPEVQYVKPWMSRMHSSCCEWITEPDFILFHMPYIGVCQVLAWKCTLESACVQRWHAGHTRPRPGWSVMLGKMRLALDSVPQTSYLYQTNLIKPANKSLYPFYDWRESLNWKYWTWAGFLCVCVCDWLPVQYQVLPFSVFLIFNMGLSSYIFFHSFDVWFGSTSKSLERTYFKWLCYGILLNTYQLAG